MYKEILSSRLKQARIDTGFTQREVSKETGINHINIARYETGTREPDIETLAKLADFYGQSIDWLAGRNFKSNVHRQEKYIADMEKSIKKERKAEAKRLAK